jgi:hypothetical protein
MPRLPTAIRVPLLGLRCALVEGLFQRIQSKVAAKGVGHTPAHDAAGKRIDDEGHVDKAAPGRQWSERPGVVELSPGLSSPNRTCTSQRIRLSIQVLLKAKATSA